MSTVVAQPYSTEGNGGRKLVALSNGWLVAGVVKTTEPEGFSLFVDKQDGNGFVEAYQYTITSFNANTIAMVSEGTNVHVIFGFATWQVYHQKFNILTGERTAAFPFENGQTIIGKVSLAINPQGTELHAAWACKNETYSNTFNLRYAKGKINGDGSVTWGTVEQVSKATVTTESFHNPSVVLKDNVPYIIFEYKGGGPNYQIGTVFKGSGTSWYNNTTKDGWTSSLIHAGGTYNQTSPSSIVDKNGVIHVVWSGLYSGYTGFRNIFYSKSIDDGVNWSDMQVLSMQGVTHYEGASITADKNNELWVVWSGRKPGFEESHLWYNKSANHVFSGQQSLKLLVGEGVNYRANPSTLYDVNFGGLFEEGPPTIYNTSTSVEYIGTYSTNKVPIVTVDSPTANQTLYENGTLTMAGSTIDTDADDVVTIKYQIDSGTVRNLHSAVSDGSTPIDFSKSLTYKDGVLKDGATAVTSTLDKDVPHTVSMWAEDGKGGKSNIITRSFFVVPNRAPQVTISPITQQSALINSDVITVSGAVVDLDHNDVTVTFAINGSEEQHVLTGPPSAFTFNILLANLKTGANTVIVKATDTYNMSGTKTLTINKTHDAVPVNTAVARYQIVAPTGSAQSILLWVTRTLGNLGINAAVSLTNANEAENYVDLMPTNTGVVNGNREDEFAYQGTVSKEIIILKITYNRTDANVIDTIKQISGVLF